MPKHIKIENCKECPFFAAPDYDDPSCDQLLRRIKNKWYSHYLRHEREKTVDKKCPLKRGPITVELKKP
jgi:hypothetical protein